MLCLAAAAEMTPETLVNEAGAHVAERDTVQTEIVFVMEFTDGEEDITLTLMADIALGTDNEARIHLKMDDEEIVLVNNEAEQLLFFPKENAYRKMAPESDRSLLFRSVLSGTLESAFIWLADYLHGAPLADAEPPTFAETTTIEGDAHNAVEIRFPQHTLQAFFAKADPPVLRRFTLDLHDAALRNYTTSPDGSLRVTADFVNWQFDASLPDDTFTFTPPADAHEQGAQSPPQRGALEGQEAPNFSLPLLDGGEMSLAQHRGNDIVILDFWASWCGPCRRGLPIVATVAERFKEHNVVLYAINLRESADTARTFLQQHNLGVAVPMDGRGEVAQRYGVTGIPRLILIDREGIVRAVHAGLSPTLDRQLSGEIRALLAEEE